MKTLFLFLCMAFFASKVVAQPAEPAWSAPATTGVISENIDFEHNGIKLDGTLLLPASKGPKPVVIVFHAASSPLRNEALYDHLEEMLPALGIAVFTFDRRGNGKSEGVALGNDYQVLAGDGIAAARMLAKDQRIDPRRVGFWGLSQGGWLALLAASQYEGTAFAISVSAPMVAPDVQMNFAVANILRIKGYSDSDVDIAISARKAVDDYERGRIDRLTAEARLDLAANQPWFDLIYMGRTLGEPGKSGWAKEMRHDPLTSMPSILCPTLIFYGSEDPWVPAALSIARLRGLEREKNNFQSVVIRGADHAMMTSATQQQQIDPAFFPLQAPDSVEYFGRLAAWLQKEGIAN